MVFLGHRFHELFVGCYKRLHHMCVSAYVACTQSPHRIFDYRGLSSNLTEVHTLIPVTCFIDIVVALFSIVGKKN